MPPRVCAATIVILTCLLASSSTVHGEGRFFRRNKCSQSYATANHCGVQCCQTVSSCCNTCGQTSNQIYTWPPIHCYTTIQAQPNLYYCNGSSGNCGIHGKVTVTRSAGDLNFTDVYLLVNQHCPNLNQCPTTSFYRVDIPTANEGDLTYTADFPADFPRNDPRIVASCNNPGAMNYCIVVKLSDGTCRSFPFCGLSQCVSTPMNPCPECVFH